MSVEDDTGRGAGSRTLRAYHTVATPAAAESPCLPSSVPPTWAMEQGDTVLLSTTNGGMTGLVSAWLSAHHAPALVADDYVLVSGAERTLVIPVRAGMVCRGEAMVQLPADAAAG